MSNLDFNFNWVLDICLDTTLVDVYCQDDNEECVDSIPRCVFEIIFNNNDKLKIIDNELILNYDFTTVSGFCEFLKNEEQVYTFENFFKIASDLNIDTDKLGKIILEVFRKSEYSIFAGGLINQYTYICDIYTDLILPKYPELKNICHSEYIRIIQKCVNDIIHKITYSKCDSEYILSKLLNRGSNNSSFMLYSEYKKVAGRIIRCLINVKKHFKIELIIDSVINIYNNTTGPKYMFGYRICKILLEIDPKYKSSKQFIEDYVMSIDPLTCIDKKNVSEIINDHRRSKLNSLIIKKYHSMK